MPRTVRPNIGVVKWCGARVTREATFVQRA
jgi:hypothetical protein